MNLSHEASMSSELALTSFVEAFLLFCFFHLFYLKKKLNSFLFLVLFFFPKKTSRRRNYKTGRYHARSVLDEEEKLICVIFIAREEERLLDGSGPLIG